MSLRPMHGGRAPGWILAIALAVLARPESAGAQGVHVALMPSAQNVAPGAEFDIEIDVTEAGYAFNGFKAVVTFDPAALTFLPSSPIELQQGCLMTGACSGACGSTFHTFGAAADSLDINDILICDQYSLTGPGQIYKLHFRASTTPQVTYVRFRKATFYNAGLYVVPVATADAAIGIGVNLDAGGAPAPLPGLRLRAEPNPARGTVEFAVETDVPGEQIVEVHDVSGRLVRRWSDSGQAGGVRRLRWDGTDAAGARAPAGIYLVTARSGDRFARTRVTLLK
jgi:hypothetical protein